MKLVVFGATGGTGCQVVEQALATGHEVTAFARHPDALPIQHERLRIVQGDVLDPAAVEEPVAGQDAVISALGSRGREPTTVYSTGTGNIIRAMKASGVRRLVCISSSALDVPAHAPLPVRLVVKHVVQRVFRHAFQDMALMEEEVRRSDLDWTILRPGNLSDKPRTGRYQTAVNEQLRAMRGISRADLADYILTHLEDPATFRARIEISN